MIDSVIKTKLVLLKMNFPIGILETKFLK
jgi:hypothetical protein